MKSKIKLFYILIISILLISPTPVKAYDDWGDWDDYDYWDDWDDDWDDWDDDVYDWGAGSDDVYVYPEDDYDWGLDDDWWRDAYVYDNDDNDDWDWEEDYDDPPNNDNDDNIYQDPRVKVPDGDCLIGAIAEILRLLGTNADLTVIKNYLTSLFTYTKGVGFETNGVRDINTALQNYFNTTLPTSYYQINTHLDNKGLMFARISLGDGYHAVVVTGHTKDSSGDKYTFYDPVENRTGTFSSLDFFQTTILINSKK
jgi:hypothetical protein